MPDPITTPKHPTTSRSRRTRTFGLAVASAVVLAVAVYAAWWKIVADGLLDNIDRWRIAREAEGLGVRWMETTVAGFPNDIVVTIRAPEVRLPGRWSWQSDGIELSVSPLTLDAIQFRADGLHRIEGRRDGGVRYWEIRADMLRGRAKGGASVGSISLEVAEATVAENGRELGIVRHLDARLDRPVQPASPDTAALSPAVAYELEVDLSHEITDQTVEWPFEDRLQETAAHLAILGDVGLPLRRRSLAAWRDTGGVVEIIAASTRVGPLSLSGDGTVSLDENLQPLGAITVNAKGYGLVIDMLAERGKLSVNNIGTLKAFLDMFAKVDSTDGLRVLTAAFSLQGGKVFMGPFELGAVPSVRWPD
ncbi:MAG: DUF2125 domain-containing protein [Rhodospirillales bacterium]